MLTIFTTAKPFTGHTGVIQRNALRSWSLLEPRCQIILLGDDPGTAEAAREFGALHIADVQRSDYGLPLISDMFDIAQARADNALMCFANADIILMQDFMRAAGSAARSRSRFLGVGRRWNLDVTGPLDFAGTDWPERLRQEVRQRGELFLMDAMDYFVFPRGFYSRIPPFAVGREGWDNWMIYQARRQLAPVLDITRAAVVVHQNHDFGKFKDAGQRRTSDETARNKEFVGTGFFDLRDATHEVSADGAVRQTWRRNFRWHLWRACLLFPGLRHILAPLSRIKRTFKSSI